MIAKIFRVLFSFNKKIFHDDSALSNFSGYLFLVTAAKLENKLQFRNMKVSAFVFRKEAKKKNWVAPHYGELYVGCCMLQSQQEDSTTT